MPEDENVDVGLIIDDFTPFTHFLEKQGKQNGEEKENESEQE